MTKENFKSRERIIDMMTATANRNGRKVPRYEMERVADRLHRMEATLSRLAEDQCCFPVYDEAKQKRTEARALALISEKIGCKAYTQRDPRGYAIRLYLMDEEGRPWFNSWDGETTGLAW